MLRKSIDCSGGLSDFYLVSEKGIERVYKSVLTEHLAKNRQMAFVTGPRQVGKTTLCREMANAYFDWDNDNHRDTILAGVEVLAGTLSLGSLRDKGQESVICIDEIHKYARWKTFLKGFFDTYENECRIMVTGSSRLDVYKRGGDSLMGRYFVYRMHPLGVSELLGRKPGERLVLPPCLLDEEEFRALWQFGGFPEPFQRRDKRFSTRWNRLRGQQLFREDLRELTRIQELGQVEALGKLLASRSGEQVAYSGLAKEVRVDDKTVRSWIATLVSFHYGFLIRPWYRNITRSLRKEPKWFLRDWSVVMDEGQRAETFVACHLLKAVEGWTDLGFGEFELRYLRDKQKREVDFVVIRDGFPWFLVEVKLSETTISPNLEYFQDMAGCRHAFQVVVNEDYVDRDCFDISKPVAVPARTFLSQLSV